MSSSWPPRLEYTGGASDSDAATRTVDVNTYTRDLVNAMRAGSAELRRSIYLIDGSDPPIFTELSDDVKASFSAEEKVVLNAQQVKDKLKFYHSLLSAKSELVGHIDNGMGKIAKQMLSRSTAYQKALKDGDPSTMIAEIKAVFSANSLAQTADEQRTLTILGVGDMRQLPGETYYDVAARFIRVLADSKLATIGWTDANSVDVFTNRTLDKNTYGSYLGKIKEMKDMTGVQALKDIPAVLNTLDRMAAPLYMIQSSAKTDTVMVAGEAKVKQYNRYHCRHCRNLAYASGTEPTERHYASNCPHPSVTDEEKANSLAAFKKKIEAKDKKKLQKEGDKRALKDQLASVAKKETVAVTTTSPPPAASFVSDVETMKSIFKESMKEVLATEVLMMAQFRDSEDKLIVADLPGKFIALDSAATTGAKVAPNVGSPPPRLLKDKRVGEGAGGSFEVEYAVQSSLPGMDAMMMKLPMSLNEIISLAQSSDHYHHVSDFARGKFIMLIPHLSSNEVLNADKWGCLFLERKGLYLMSSRFRVDEHKKLQWKTENTEVIDTATDTKETMARATLAVHEAWPRALSLCMADVPIKRRETMLPVTDNSNEDFKPSPQPRESILKKLLDSKARSKLLSKLRLPSSTKKTLDATVTADDMLERLSTSERQRIALVNLTSQALMCTNDALKKMIQRGALKDCKFSGEDIDKATRIFGVDLIEAVSNRKSTATHVDKDEKGVPSRARIYERAKDGATVPDDVLHVDCAEIAGVPVLATVLEKCKATKIVTISDMTTAHATKKVVDIVKYFLAKGRTFDRSICDKGTNLVGDSVKSALAMFGVELLPVPTNKHDGQVESIIRPAREKVMESLRRIAGMWDTVPPVEFLDGLLIQYSNVHAFQTMAAGDDLTTGQRLFGRNLSEKEQVLRPGTAVMWKIPESTVTKHDEKGTVCVYLATKVTPMMTCVVYNMSKQKLEEVAFNDLVVIKITAEMKASLKQIADQKGKSGRKLKLGDGSILKMTSDRYAYSDGPQQDLSSKFVSFDDEYLDHDGGEKGGVVEQQELQDQSAPRLVPPPIVADEPSFVSNVEWVNGSDFSSGSLVNNIEYALATMPALANVLKLAVARKRVRVKAKKELMMSISIRQGMKMYPDLWRPSAIAELENVFAKALVPIDWAKEKEKYRDCVCPSMMLQDMKKDANGNETILKSRLVGGGNRQNPDDVGDTSAPTISYSALLIRETIACFRNEHRMTSDVSGAFLHAKHPPSEKPVIIMLSELVTNLACDIWPELRKLVYKGRLYARSDYEIYGTLLAAKLWAATLMDALEKRGYKPNRWEPCLWNRDVNGVQISCAIFVDDQRWYCLTIEIIRDDIAYLNSLFGKPKPMKSCGDKITGYIGLVWDCSKDHECRVTCPKHMKELLELVPITGTRASPGTDDAMEVVEESPKLPEPQRILFTKVVCKALYICTHVRGDALTVTTHLTRRCTKANEDDWEKMIHLLQYFNGTQGYGLLLKPGKSLRLVFYCDASAGNDSLHSTSGTCGYLGDSGFGAHNGGNPIFWGSKRQKYVATASAHAELGCLSDYLPQMLWTRYVLIDQGIESANDPFVVFEDNEACISFAERGRAAVGPMSKHLRLRMFLVKEYIDEQELRMAYIMTDLQRADLLTKSVTGTQFKRLVRTLVHPD